MQLFIALFALATLGLSTTTPMMRSGENNSRKELFDKLEDVLGDLVEHFHVQDEDTETIKPEEEIADNSKKVILQDNSSTKKVILQDNPSTKPQSSSDVRKMYKMLSRLLPNRIRTCNNALADEDPSTTGCEPFRNLTETRNAVRLPRHKHDRAPHHSEEAKEALMKTKELLKAAHMAQEARVKKSRDAGERLVRINGRVKRVRRDEFHPVGSVTTEHGCIPRDTVMWETNTRTLCKQCAATTQLPADRYPTEVNELICDEWDDRCLYYEGECIQDIVYVKFRVDELSIGLTRLDEWPEYDQPVRIGCNCQLLEDSTLSWLSQF